MSLPIKSINDALILDSFNKENRSNYLNFEETKKKIKCRFPSLCDKEIDSFIDILSFIKENDNDQCELAVTAPNSFRLKNKTIRSQIEKIINYANKEIIITGYSVSSYFDDFADLLIEKSKKGILIKLYLNEYENSNIKNKIGDYLGKFMRVFVYKNNNDKMAALHAKIISADNEISLISSANLSFHGLEGNIEIGTIIRSKNIAKQVKNLLEELIFQKIFKEIKK